MAAKKKGDGRKAEPKEAKKPDKKQRHTKSGPSEEDLEGTKCLLIDVLDTLGGKLDAEDRGKLQAAIDSSGKQDLIQWHLRERLALLKEVADLKEKAKTKQGEADSHESRAIDLALNSPMQADLIELATMHTRFNSESEILARKHGNAHVVLLGDRNDEEFDSCIKRLTVAEIDAGLKFYDDHKALGRMQADRKELLVLRRQGVVEAEQLARKPANPPAKVVPTGDLRDKAPAAAAAN